MGAGPGATQREMGGCPGVDWSEMGGALPSLPNKNFNSITSWWFFTNPFEKCARQNGVIFPKNRGENEKYLKPPPR